MINVRLTRHQILGLMKELPETHWMQIRLLEALAKNDSKVKHIDLHPEDNPSLEDPKLLTAKDVPFRNNSFNTYKKEYVKDEKTPCDFDRSWSGKCGNPSIEGANQCLEHFNVKCSMCQKVSVTDCGETFQFVCGAPLCQDHSNRHNCASLNRR